MLDLLLDVTDLLDTVFFPLLAFELIVLVRLRQLGWARLKEMLGNGGAFALFLPAGILGVGLWAAAFDAVDGWIPWSIRTTGWTVLLAIVVADFLYYWEHRLGHELRLLWDLYHSVHHSSRQYDQTTNLRLGVFDGLLSLGFSLPMIARKCEARTRRRTLAAIRGLFRFLVDREYLDEDPTSTVGTPRSARPLPTSVGVGEIEALLAAPDRTTRAGCRDAAMLELLYASGLRVAELVSLRVENIHFATGAVRAWGKGSKERTVPLGDLAIDALQDYLDVSRPQYLRDETEEGLFLSNRGRRMSRQSACSAHHRHGHHHGLAV